MIACRRDRRRTRLVAAALALAALFLIPSSSAADDNPNGRVISEVLPVGNMIRTPDQIRAIMHARPGVRYEEAVVQEDVRRLHGTKWFVPGGISILTKNDPDGRVTVLVYVTELPSVIEEVYFVGAQHMSRTELQNLTGVRKGEPMNPLANELGAVALRRKYQEDGRYFASVELVEGKKPTDTRVIFQIVEGPKVKVAGVDFRGVDEASTARLRTQLVTKRELAGFLGGTFTPITMDLDRQKLIAYYEGLGFLDVQVTPEVVQVPGDLGHVRIVYHIVEGKRNYVGGKQIDGVKSYPIDAINALADELRPGDRYDKWLVEKEMARIKAYYGNRGTRLPSSRRSTPARTTRRWCRSTTRCRTTAASRTASAASSSTGTRSPATASS